MAVLGLRFCARAFSSCGEWGPLFIAAHGPVTIAASLVAEQRLQMLRLSSCRSRAQLLRGMWDLPRPGLEPVSPALAGRFSTTAPPGKPCMNLWIKLASRPPTPILLVYIFFVVAFFVVYIYKLVWRELTSWYIKIFLWPSIYSKLLFRFFQTSDILGVCVCVF